MSEVLHEVHVISGSDRNMEPCLNLMVDSCARHLRPGWTAIFHLYVKDFGPAERRRLEETVAAHEGRARLDLHDVDQMELGVGKGIAGNMMCYVVLGAFEQTPASHAIWIDADMIVLTDIVPALEALQASDKIAAAVSRRPLRESHPMEREMMKAYGMSDEDRFFNSAFVVADCDDYRARNGYQETLMFMEKHPEQGDQGALNWFFMHRALWLDPKYNVPHWPHQKAEAAAAETHDQVVHFIGSPKPWDVGGRLFHANRSAFAAAMRQSAFQRHYDRWRFNAARWKRFLRLAPRYGKLAKAKLKPS
ncbi:MAG: glycosyltransferase family 8 protein [Opitutales bacterium]